MSILENSRKILGYEVLVPLKQVDMATGEGVELLLFIFFDYDNPSMPQFSNNATQRHAGKQIIKTL